MIGGHVGASAAGAQGGYDTGYAAERRFQSGWIVGRPSLD